MSARKLFLSAVAGLFGLGLVHSSAVIASGESSGGGHGVPTTEGKITLLDLVENPEVALIESLALLSNPETSAAASDAWARIEQMRPSQPKFVDALESKILELKWYFSKVPLKPIGDFDLGVPTGLMPPQVARQTSHGEILIDRDLFEQMTPAGRAALIIHEAVLGLFHLDMPRPLVRDLVKTLFSDRPNPAPLNAMDAYVKKAAQCTLSVTPRSGWFDQIQVFVDGRRAVSSFKNNAVSAKLNLLDIQTAAQIMVSVVGLSRSEYQLRFSCGSQAKSFALTYTLPASVQTLEWTQKAAKTY